MASPCSSRHGISALPSLRAPTDRTTGTSTGSPPRTSPTASTSTRSTTSAMPWRAPSTPGRRLSAWRMPTFGFIQSDGGLLDVNHDPEFANRFLLDLNDGLDVDYSLAALQSSPTHTVTVSGEARDPNAFVDELTGDLTVIYGANEPSGTSVKSHVGDPSFLPGFEIV